MSNDSLRDLACLLKDRGCGCGKSKCSCNKNTCDRYVVAVDIHKIPGEVREKQLIVTYSDGSVYTSRYEDIGTDDNTFIESFTVENGIVIANYNNGSKKQVVNLNNYALSRDFVKLKSSVEGITGISFEDTDITIDCSNTPKKTNKPYRKGDNVYIINECGEEELLFSITDSEKCQCSEPTPIPPAPVPNKTVTITGQYKNSVTVTTSNGSTYSNNTITGNPNLNATITAQRVEGKVFKHFLMNDVPVIGNTYTIADGTENLTIEPIYEDEPRVTPPTPSVFPYNVLARVDGGNGSLNIHSQVVRSESDTITFIATPNAGYEVDPSSKLTYRHSDYPNKDIVVRFRLKSNRAYTGGNGYTSTNDTSVLVTPNECYIDGSNTPNFSVTVNANEIPYNGNVSITPNELSNAVQVVFSQDKLQATITYNCQLLQGRKPVVRLTDNAGRYVDVNLSDFKPALPTEPEKVPMSFSTGQDYTVDSNSKTITVSNKCYIGEEGTEYFDVTIPYTGDFKEHMLEGFTSDMVQVTHNEQTKTINMRFFCRVLNGFREGVVKLLDWLGNTWRVILGDYKQVEPPTPKKRYNVTVRVDDANNISHFLVNNQRYTNDVNLEFEEGSAVRIVAYSKAETEEHTYSIIEVGNTQGNEYHIEDLISNANVSITTRKSERELFYPLHVNVDNVENIAGYTVNNEMSFESKTFNIRKGTQVRIEAQPKDSTAEHRYSIVSVGGTHGNTHTIDSMSGAQTVDIVTRKETATTPQPPVTNESRAYLVEVLGGGTVRNSGNNSAGYIVGRDMLFAPNQAYLRQEGEEYGNIQPNEIVPAQEPGLRGFNTNYPVPKATDFQALIGGVYQTLDEEGRYDGEPYLHIETRNDATNYIFLQPTNYKVRVHDEGKDQGLPGGNTSGDTGGEDSNPDDNGGIEWDGRSPNTSNKFVVVKRYRYSNRGESPVGKEFKNVVFVNVSDRIYTGPNSISVTDVSRLQPSDVMRITKNGHIADGNDMVISSPDDNTIWEFYSDNSVEEGDIRTTFFDGSTGRTEDAIQVYYEPVEVLY